MPPQNSPPIKSELHPRNKNRERYDLDALIIVEPDLAKYVKANKFGDASVDFSNLVAVKLLNKALLNHYYGIEYWEFPEQNLCPPIPGRADYMHYVADLLAESNNGIIPTGNAITCLDIGMGANCIYPILGVTEYGWNFIGSDIDPTSIASAQNIVSHNASLKGKIECRLQENPRSIFMGILGDNEKIDVTVCNPPFHASAEEAAKGTQRKVKNLLGKQATAKLNFAGVSNELIYNGGELTFITNMAFESRKMAKNCYWFTTLVSKQANLKSIYKLLHKLEVTQTKTIVMGTGNKTAHVVAWTFLSDEERNTWRATRWEKA